MKATGIVRRVDDLGRIVIPKEIRRTLRIREEGFFTYNTDTFRTIHDTTRFIHDILSFAEE